ncbi:unnamed protein product [Brassicogethes aeneus]|uniref:CHK kinase-like domain-containing protein n=1 Tax=Brassicogethes aeneus TaxID=1431903 RepID=A0A9P0FCC2_BRAAE|nr:unnamed protein product [Brassicogethes aeneus]
MEHNLNVKILKLLNEIAEENGLKNWEIKVKNDSGKCEGFASVIVPVDLICDNEAVLELIVKIAPGEELRKTIPFEKVFEREVFVYKHVLPAFRQLEVNNRVVGDKTFTNYAKCYKTSLENLEEVLIIENLSSEYKLWKKNVPLDDNHIKLVLQNYAKLHALSFVLKNENPALFDTFKSNSEDVYMDIIKKCGTAGIIRNLISRVLKSESVRKDLKTFEKLTKFQSEVIDVMSDLINIQASGDYGVVGHGDNWTNNMLFKYENSNGLNELQDVKFIDWQLSRFGSPVLDLSYFLCTSSGKESLKGLNKLLKVYHSRLTQQLAYFKLDVEQIFPWHTLMEHWKKFSKFGLGMSFLVVNVAVMTEHECPDVERQQNSEDFLKTFEIQSVNDSEYCNRMQYILQHFVDTNLL